MIRLTVISLAGLIGVLMAFEEPASEPENSNASGVDEVVMPAVERVTLRRISQPEAIPEVVTNPDPAPAQIIQAAAPATTVSRPVATVQGTVVHSVGTGQTLPEMLQIVSRDAPADARTRPAPSASATTANNSVAAVWFVSGSRVNLRSGPSTSNRVVTSLTRDTAVELIGSEGDWAHLRVVNTGAEGFMAQRFLRN